MLALFTVLALFEFIDPQKLADIGLVAVLAAVFAESGLLIGIFLPGDSLLFTAGIVASQSEHLDIVPLALGCFIAAVLGDAVGYWFGARTGPALFKRDDGRIFRRHHLEKARAFYETHGGRTIVLARFVPIVRTFAPIVAGAAGMPYRRFFGFNVLGGLLWGVGLTVAGFALGNAIPDIDKYLLPVVGGIIVLSLVPVLLEARKHQRRRGASRSDER